MAARVHGIHHVTAIAGDPQENVDFYAGLLGMRLVKRSVNQDDPGTYHLFYADAVGHPGSDLTFFPWPQAERGANGAGAVNEVVLAVPPGALAYWRDRLAAHGVVAQDETRFGEPTLAFRDPHGLHVALAETERALRRDFAPWPRSPVPEAHQVRGIHAARIVVGRSEATEGVATHLMGMSRVGADAGWTRYEGADPASGFLEVKADPAAPRARVAVGVVHHVAWRVRDEQEEGEVMTQVRRGGLSTTPFIDRFWFKSVYFREPGGVLFELATDGPGFGVDEDMETLGEALVLPPWLEERREDIEAVLPPLSLPHLEGHEKKLAP